MSDVQQGSSVHDEPVLNIGAVSRMTGIPETTLRAWERRYQFPESARTAGGHRLYSEREVARLQWVKARVDAGMQVSQAIRALRQSQDEDGGPTILSAPGQLKTRNGRVDPIALFRQRLVDALLQHDAALADRVLAEAHALFALETVILDVIGPAFYDIGEAWAAGRADVATEHFATNHLRHHLHQWLQIGPPPYRVHPVVLACAPGELHEGGLLMLAVLLRRLRWPVIYLGQTMPLLQLVDFLKSVEASVAVFVAMTEQPARTLAEWPQWLPEVASSGQPIMTFAGRIFLDRPELVESVPGVYLGPTLREGVETLSRLLHEMNPVVR